MKKKIIILGAGVTGLTLAYQLQDTFDVTVYEKEGEAGGLCRSREHNGFKYDYGYHVLWNNDQPTIDFIEKDLGVRLDRQKRRAAIQFEDRLIPYPFQANLGFLPGKVRYDCLKGILIRDQINPGIYHDSKPGESYISWLYKSYGDGIVHYFMQPYNEKFWMYPLAKMTSDWCSRFPLLNVDNILKRMFLDDSEEFGGNAEILYPESGRFQDISDSLYNKVKDKVRLNTNILQVDIKNKAVLVGQGHHHCNWNYDILISTIPYNHLIYISEPSLHSLTDMHVITVAIGLNHNNVPDKHWIYFHEDEYHCYRINFMNQLKNTCPEGKSLLLWEINSNCINSEYDAEWQGFVRKDLLKLGYIKKNKDIEFMDYMCLSPAYVIFNQERNSVMEKYNKIFKENSIYTAGRYGSWKYCNTNDCIKEARDMSQKLKEVLEK